jgi:hypothetical protein
MIKLRDILNEASMPPVRKVVNAILKKHGVVPMKTTSTSVRGFHNIQRGGYRYEGNYFLGFYGVPQDIIDKVGDEMKKAGVKGVDVRKGIISADFTKTGLKESVNEGNWSKIMAGVRKGSQSGSWTIVVIKNNKVIHQKDVKFRDAIPAHYEDIKKKFKGATLGIEDGSGQMVYTEKI